MPRWRPASCSPENLRTRESVSRSALDDAAERAYISRLKIPRHASLFPRSRAPDRQPSSFDLDALLDVRRMETPQEAAMAVGTVKFFNTQKGFGFIEPEGGGKDVFVHISALERAGLSHLADGQRVSFEVEKDQRGRDNVTNIRAE
jgi:CspA family cold shock protein